MGTITALKAQKRNRDRVNVYIDGQFAFGLAAIEAVRLRVGQTLSGSDVERLQERDSVESAYERALNFLSYRPRSEAEVRRNLGERGSDEATIEAVIERLLNAGLLDDEQFARYWLSNRNQFNPRGERAVRFELSQKGVPAAVIDRVLADRDAESEERLARQAAASGAKRLQGLPRMDFERRLFAYLMRRGFAPEVARDVIAELDDAQERSEDNMENMEYEIDSE